MKSKRITFIDHISNYASFLKSRREKMGIKVIKLQEDHAEF